MSFEGTTGPYVQYTYVRAKSILRKSNWNMKYNIINWIALTDEVSYSLIKALSNYGEVVNKAAERYEPSVIARYTIQVATAFNKFYHECSILKVKAEEKVARLLLVDVTQQILRDALWVFYRIQRIGEDHICC